MVAPHGQTDSINEHDTDTMQYAPLQKLHSYQSTALQLSLEASFEEVSRQLVVMATGTGKTVLFATLPLFHKFKKSILVLVHRALDPGEMIPYITKYTLS